MHCTRTSFAFDKLFPRLLLVPFLLVLGAICAFADIYKYVDPNGTVHFVDDAGKIPQQFRNRSLVSSGDNSAVSAHAVTKIGIVRDQVLIPVTLHHRGKSVTASFLVDTGATTTTITPELARKLGVDFATARMAVAQVAGGALLTVKTVKLDRIDVGPTSRVDMEVDIIGHEGPPVQFDGFLGMNYLRNYRYVIDFENYVVQWE